MCVCVSLRFRPPLSETPLGAASGGRSVSTPEIYGTLGCGPHEAIKLGRF